MIEKLKKLLNVKAWFTDVLFTKVSSKGGKAAAAFILALLASPKVAPYLPKLQEFGVNVDPQLLAGAISAFIVGALLNWSKRVMEKN
jgi:hypothetical protein